MTLKTSLILQNFLFNCSGINQPNRLTPSGALELRSCFSFCGNSSFDLPKPAILIVDVCFSKESPQTSYRGCLPTHILIVGVLRKILLDPHPSVLIFSTLKPMIVRYQLNIWRLFLWAHFGFNLWSSRHKLNFGVFFGSVDSIDPTANELAPPLRFDFSYYQ